MASFRQCFIQETMQPNISAANRDIAIEKVEKHKRLHRQLTSRARIVE